MKSKIVLSILLFSILKSFGQNPKDLKLDKQDSIHLENTWNLFSKSIKTKDTNQLRQISLRLVDCIRCVPSETSHTLPGYLIPIDTFLFQLFQSETFSKILSTTFTKKHSFTVRKIPNYHPRNLPSKKENDLIVYEIWFVTWEPNEIAKGHEGGTHCFEFIKTNGQFKFYGFDTVP